QQRFGKVAFVPFPDDFRDRTRTKPSCFIPYPSVLHIGSCLEGFYSTREVGGTYAQEIAGGVLMGISPGRVFSPWCG
ncbi:hypothetical protein ACC771_25025, partial [Rhizobium ruizarguesonis]